MGCPSMLKVLDPHAFQYVLITTFNWRPTANSGSTPNLIRPCLCLKAQFIGYQAGDTNRVFKRGQPFRTQFSGRFRAQTFLQAKLDEKDRLPLMFSRHFLDTWRGRVFDVPDVGPDFGRHFLGLKLSAKTFAGVPLRGRGCVPLVWNFTKDRVSAAAARPYSVHITLSIAWAC